MISRKFKTLFVHIPKTAGQSVETVFLQAEGLAWEDRAALLLRPNADPAKGPERLAHLYASEYVRLGYLSQAEFDRFYKFAVVRDPYTLVLSEYRYRYAETGMPLDDFLGLSFDSDFSNDARHLVPQSTYVTDAAGKLIVDRLIRFEALDAGMVEVWRMVFGADTPAVHWKVKYRPVSLLERFRGGSGAMPHRNKSVEGLRGAADLTPAQRAIIEQRYAVDFQLFNYPFFLPATQGLPVDIAQGVA